MTEPRSKPGWALWTAVVLVGLPILYVLSFGPACWWMSEQPIPFGRRPRYAPRCYAPIGWIACRGGPPVQVALAWYAGLFQSDPVLVPESFDEQGDSRGIWMHGGAAYFD